MAPVVNVLETRDRSSFSTAEFETWNEAHAYALKCAALNPTKPYKRIRATGAPLWCVTVVNRAAMLSEPAYKPFLREPGAYWHGCTECVGTRQLAS